MRKVHRFLAVFAVFFGLYVGTTGTLIQLIDLKTLLGHAPASDPNLQSIREGYDGPPNFQVLGEGDYFAPALPADFNFDTALAAVLKSAHAAAGAVPIRFVELRMADGKPVGQVAAQGRLLRVDAVTGAMLVGPGTAPRLSLPPQGGPEGKASLRGRVKDIHRMLAYGDPGVVAYAIIALTLCAMLFTGLMQYFRLLRARSRMGRPGLFWTAGGRWRTAHRMIAVAASIFLVVIVLSGTLLAVASVGISIYKWTHNGLRPGLTADVSSPLTDAELTPMLHTTLGAYRAVSPTAPIRVLRLRYFAGMPQGVIVTGGEVATQLAFNTATGRLANLTEPGYPATGQPFGWQWDQTVKNIHRGDFIGLPGRFISLFTGLSLLFLTVSGAAMYFDLWNKRRKAGRHGLFWP